MKQKIMQWLEKFKIFLRHRKFNENRFDSYFKKINFSGNIDYTGQVVFDSMLVGDMNDSPSRLELSSIVVKQTAQINGNIRGDFVVVEGVVVGNVTGVDKVIIRKSARITGTVTYGFVIVEDGAIINGSFVQA